MRDLYPTPLTRARSVERALDLPRVFLKRDGSLPTGSHKYRAAQAVCGFVAAQGIGRIAVASCGNYASGLLRAAEPLRLTVDVFVPEGTHTLNPSAIGNGSINYTATYEDAVLQVEHFARRGGILDVTPGGLVATLVRHSLGTSAVEIEQQLQQRPGAVFCPVGNGTTLAGLFERFVGASTASALPRLYAAGVGENALFAESHEAVKTSSDARLEPLRSLSPLDSHGAQAAVILSRGAFVRLDSQALTHAQSLLETGEAIRTSLAGAAAVAALIARRPELPAGSASTIVCLLTSDEAHE